MFVPTLKYTKYLFWYCLNPSISISICYNSSIPFAMCFWSSLTTILLSGANLAILNNGHNILIYLHDNNMWQSYKLYRWKWESSRRDNPEINPSFDGRVRIYDETSLQISPVVESDSGLYTCTLLVPLSQSDSRRYSHQVFLDVRG